MKIAPAMNPLTLFISFVFIDMKINISCGKRPTCPQTAFRRLKGTAIVSLKGLKCF